MQNNKLSTTCPICLEEDTKHQTIQCPKGQIVYHGTTLDCAKLIESSSFRSTMGRIGKGVYMTPNLKIAKIVAIKRAQERNQQPALLKCIIPTCSRVSRVAQHPKWKDMTTKSFREILVKDTNRIFIEGVQNLNQEISQQIQQNNWEELKKENQEIMMEQTKVVMQN